ncbi:hypothetical protein Q5424_25420 [Conexibacter sp. JD483]|uniref:hypothetical protein n=1 Tax=unclassified Conexibacter TaxID=2627773 RepID=UPI00271A5B17|nr:MULTISPECIES: hypothetical protein [unclassified Conexibacter]MDO8188159.1 hypothetical protein [Conexibacter sp. CPCC 205706]MDO8202007.1 hypothetical protein [Conexibacter sp. CPCC 205762]MDR9372463.1 hypothetical protein [Conexibacter sp. JD483]
MALACTAAMAFAGCGSASEEERERSDSERARAALLRQADLPVEWTRIDDDGETPQPSAEARAKMCPGYPAEWLFSAGDDYVTFESDLGVVIHGVTTVADGTDAAAQFEDLGSPRSLRCVSGTLTWSMQQANGESEIELKLGKVRTELLKRGGDERGVHIETTLGTPDGSVEIPVEADFLATHEGDHFSTVAVLGLQEPVNPALRDRLAEIAAQRLQQVFG